MLFSSMLQKEIKLNKKMNSIDVADHIFWGRNFAVEFLKPFFKKKSKTIIIF